MTNKTYEQSFPISGQAVLKLSNIRGTVSVRQGDPAVIQVKADLDETSGNAERTQVEMRQEEGGRVVVETRYGDMMLDFLNRSQPCRVDYIVSVPAGAEIKISTVSATQDIQSLQGKFHLSTVSGSLRLADLKGDLSLSTISGGVQCSGLSGDKLTLSAVSGDIQLGQAEYAAVDANTVSGQIHYTAPLGQGPYTFRSVSGDINWEMPSAAPCTIEMHAVSGDLQINIPVTRSKTERGTKLWHVQGGGSLIKLNSVSGNLNISAPQVSQDSSLSRKEILDKIEAGEMTAEEALTALSNL